MPLNRWKALKAALIAVLITAIAIVAIVWQGDPTAVGIAAIVAVLVAAGANVKEVEIARALTITFRNGKRREPRDDQDQE